jgi:heme oxygenase
MSAHAIVKIRTAAAHRMVDATYSRFDLADRDSYINFLQAHARIVPPIEAVLGHRSNLPQWRPRAALLSRDLDAFCVRPSKPLAVIKSLGLAQKFGLLYVLEGSRLGGRLLLQRVGLGYSSHYLSAKHTSGEWRAFTVALDDRARAENEEWLEGVVAGANHGFELYELSATELFTEAGRRT